ncbi:FAD:protein FMN transferase [Sulfurimonas sp.]|uniref:FAD:protein FMN transferase n=1 Tax=Sulfurimonas sp. TaxID=2022749 RepID=UPI003D09B669
MSFFENGLKAKVMSTQLIIEANVSKKILFEALNLVKQFEEKYSAYKSNSLVSLINHYSGVQAIPLSDEDREIFEKALDIAETSDGLFDPTIGVLTQGLYGFGTDHSKIPNEQEIYEVKKLVNYKKLKIDNDKVFLEDKGMQLDLGGIGKGYIADKVVEFLLRKGATKGLVSAGGEIVTFGKNYTIAIKNPFEKGNIGVIHSSKTPLSISTSGDYERFIGSKEHHHILDNKSAKQNHFYSSITLIQNGVDATLLDGVSTIAFNSKPEHLQSIAQKFNIAIIAISKEKEIYMKNLQNLDIKNIDIYPF